MFGLDDLNPIRAGRKLVQSVDPLRAVTGEKTRIPIVSDVLDVAENATDSVLKDADRLVSGESARRPRSQRDD